MLTNTAKTAPFDHRRTHPILGKKTQCFKCNQWDQVESDFILSFIHLRVRKMYFNAFLITLCSKIDSIWVCSSGPVMDSPHDLIEFIKNLNIEILWFFLHKLKIVFLSKLWNKKWGSPCSFVLQSWRCSKRAHHLLSTFPFLSEDWGEFLWNTRRGQGRKTADWLPFSRQFVVYADHLTTNQVVYKREQSLKPNT